MVRRRGGDSVGNGGEGGGGVSEGGGGAVGFVDYNQTPQNELNTLTYVLEI